MQIKDLAIFDQMPINFFIKDSEGKYLWVNEPTYKMAQLGSREEMIGKSDLDMIWAKADGTKLFMKNDQDVLETGKILKNEEHATLPSGKTIKAQACKFVGELEGQKCLVGFAIIEDE